MQALTDEAKYSIEVITMKNINLISFLFFSLIFIPAFLNVNAQENAKEIKECKVKSKEKIKYKLISIGRSIREPFITGLRIVVKDKYYNKEDMTQLSKIIKARYCNEENIAVTIFDEAKTAKIADIIIKHLSGERITPEIRGFYTLERENNIEKLSFSKKRGNSATEVSLQLTKEPLSKNKNQIKPCRNFLRVNL